NDTGTTPIVHQAGDFRWAFEAGTLMHEMGHNLQLCHYGPATLSTGPEVVFVTSDNGRLYKVDALTGVALGSVDTRRPCCPKDEILATPSVMLYQYANPLFQNAMMAERGHPDDLVIVATHYGDASNRVIAYYASDLTLKWAFNVSG